MKNKMKMKVQNIKSNNYKGIYKKNNDYEKNKSNAFCNLYNIRCHHFRKTLGFAINIRHLKWNLSRFYLFLIFIVSSLSLVNVVLCNNNNSSNNNNNNENNIYVDFNNKEDETTLIENIGKYANESLGHELHDHTHLIDDNSVMVWSEFLEDYVVSQRATSRTPKDFQFLMHNSPNGGPGIGNQQMMGPGIAQGPINYHSSAYKRPSIMVTKRIGESAVELEPHMRPPVNVVNPQFRPMLNQMVNQESIQQQQQRQQPGFLQQLFGFGGSTNQPVQHHQQQQQQQQQQQPLQTQHQLTRPQGPPHSPPSPQGFRAVTENDLYLLGAIEKLVYRVDYLESRLRRAEQLIYYLMAGNKQQEGVRDPCPGNFTRISDNCYYINSKVQVNWKTANSACKGLNAHLAEFEKISENEDIMAYLLNQASYRGLDYWLGGLNPGLLWIWSNSAKPVNPNMNLTSIAMSHEHSNATESNTIDGAGKKSDKDAKDQSNDTKNSTENILNNTVEIKGNGRCLRLSYNSSKNSYVYHGQECTSRHFYICEYEDKTLDNKIKKIARALNLSEGN